MTVHYADDMVTLHQGEALDVLRALPNTSIDAVCTDPPYGLEFMGKDWDAPWSTTGINADAGFKGGGVSATKRAPSFTGSTNPNCQACGGKMRGRRDGTALVAVCVCDSPSFPNVRAVEMAAFQAWCETWAHECLRVLKPGAYLLAFGGTRTVHRLTCALEDAGFEIRDGIDWVYGSGFPKSLDVSKAIDKAAGAEREIVGTGKAGASSLERVRRVQMGYRQNLTDVTPAAYPITAPATEDAARWAGWGTALKPAREPIVVARKPFAASVAANVLAHGTGALNIDACRTTAGQDYREKCASVVGLHSNRNGDAYGEWTGVREDSAHPAGRWPTNVVLSHAATPAGVDLCAEGCVDGCPVAEMDRQSGVTVSRVGCPRTATSGGGWRLKATGAEYDDAGGASRFFPVFRYEAKASTAERPRDGQTAHPTVKPLDLMRWLVRLVTPPGGTVLDPFAGSGTTGEACVIEGFPCVLIEREAAYLPLIVARLTKPLQPTLDIFGGVA